MISSYMVKYSSSGETAKSRYYFGYNSIAPSTPVSPEERYGSGWRCIALIGKTMKKISLVNGGYTLVDDGDFDWLNQWRWRQEYGYALREFKRRKVFLHRFILGIDDKSLQIDHADRDGLNNQRNNLRVCTVAENAMNRKTRGDSKYGFKGVTFISGNNKWQARITVDKKRISLGRFSTPQEAFLAYVDAAQKFFGEYARFE